jgi:hypothetical protein
MSAIRLPACLTTEQFAFLVQINADTVRRKIRARVIKGMGNPTRIPVSELLKWGVDLNHAAIILHERTQQSSSPSPA